MFHVKITVICSREALMNEINQGKFLKRKNKIAGSVDPKTLK